MFNFRTLLSIGIKTQTQWKVINRQLREQWAAHLKRNKLLNINDKIAFATADNKFSDQPDCPAILTALSSIRMPVGRNREVMAHKLFWALPRQFKVISKDCNIGPMTHLYPLRLERKESIIDMTLICASIKCITKAQQQPRLSENKNSYLKTRTLDKSLCYWGVSWS